MRRALLLLLLLGLPASVRAMWAYVSIEELVKETDIVVVGTLRDVREWSADGMDYGEGRIEVQEVIWGRVSPGDSLTLRWSNSSSIACPRVEHRGRANEEGIWLLTRDGGAVSADYPGRFVNLQERGAVLRALAQTPVALRGGDPWVGDGRPMTFQLVYRNASDSPLRFPGVGYEGGRALLPQGSRLSVKIDGNGEPRPVRLAGRDARVRSHEPVTLAPGEEQRFEFDLRELLASEVEKDEIYIVGLTLSGRGPTNEVVFYTRVRESARAESPEPKIVYSRKFTAPAERPGLAPPARAGLVALVALLLFPFFYKLRSGLAGARLARFM